ncbi:hypothetical protein SDC9_12355 [bioreactor metagenome]|uniref:Type I restriction modification DNA specificity domain-containing protein n=1 Tax=bioreactor metagenome TaxID=1076179 RepID=A0A644TIB3_9ZZZZ
MNNWKKTTLGEVCNFRRGHDLPKYDMQEGMVPVSGSNGIIGYHDKQTNIEPCITIGRSGNVGTPYYYEKCWAHNTVLYIDDYKGNDPKFIYYFIKTLNLGNYSGGSAVPTLNRNHIHPIEVYFPIDIDEQKRIADVLSALDDKIEINNKINENLEAQAQAIFKQWFVDEVDKNWKEIELGNVIETKSGGTPSRNNKLYYINGTIDWVKSKELNASFIIDTEEKITNEALKKSSAKLLPKHSILIAMYGATVGEFAIIHKEMTCNQAICALIPNNQYPYSYLYMLIKNKKTELINMAVGSAQQNISQQLIKKILVLDCVNKIKEYHQLVKPMFENIINNKIESQNLSEIRDSLLPKLMSGEVRV